MSPKPSPMPSSLSVRGECPVCYDRKEINDFRVFPCGHCFCESCVDKIRPPRNERKISCPLCRREYNKGVEVSPLGFQPVIYDSSKSHVEHVVDGINLMDKTCKTVSVKRAHNKLTKAAENIDHDNAGKLLKAIDDFAKRILPLFEELELGRTRIRELEDEQRDYSMNLKVKSRRVETLEKEAFDFQKTNGVLQQKFLEALESAELLQAKTEKSRQQLAEVKQRLVTREEEYKQAMVSLAKFKISDQRKSEKIQGLKREVIEMSCKLQQQNETRGDELDPRMDVDQDYHQHTATAPSGTHTHLPGLSSSYVAAGDGGWDAAPKFGFEAMPRPGFSSIKDATGNKKNRLTKKLPSRISQINSSFPLNLDAKGRPLAAVHIGPKSTIRVAQRF